METVARSFFRLLRAHRSQRALSRRLGYRGNPIVDWEGGRRFPNSTELFRVAALCDVDLPGALKRFHPAAAESLAAEAVFAKKNRRRERKGQVYLWTQDDPPISREGLAAWLRSLQGSQPILEIAEKSGASRFAVSRWLHGQTEPRAPQFFRLIEALTGRLVDFLEVFVDIEEIDEIRDKARSKKAIRTLAVEQPWSAAVLQLMYTSRYLERPFHDDGWIADRLGLAPAVVKENVQALLNAGLLERSGPKLFPLRPLTVDTRSDPKANRKLKQHWSHAATERIGHPQTHDLASYNLISCSDEDFARIRQILRGTFREIRAIVASSERAEVAALLQLHLLPWNKLPESLCGEDT